MSSPKPLLAAKSASPSAASPEASTVTRLNISRNYVVPPRPKPGRKPSTDTPLNRRKAQNREAQRAFRERRSQAVRDLEVRLQSQAREHAEQQSKLMAQIKQLQSQMQSGMSVQQNTPDPKIYQASSPTSLLPPMMVAPDAASPPVTTLPRMIGPELSTYSLATSPPSYGVGSPGVIPGSLSTVVSGSPNVYATPMSPFGSSPTSGDPGMELLDHVLDQKLPVPPQTASNETHKKRKLSMSRIRVPHTPRSPVPPATGLELTALDWSLPAVPLHRRHFSLEIDFTSRFKSRKDTTVPMLSISTSPVSSSPCSGMTTGQSRPPQDRCGFCTDSTPCVCAEAAAREQANMADVEMLGSVDAPPLIPMHFGSKLSPQAIEPAALSPGTTSESEASSKSECTGTPGTCTQCKIDPMSTLFCSTVASKPSSINAPVTGTYIPAQAAYQTLSRHHNFARSDFSAVVGSLITKGMQVEVNSVAKALRLLDSGGKF